MNAVELYNQRKKLIAELSDQHNKKLKLIEDEDLRHNVALMILNQANYAATAGNNLPNILKNISIPAAQQVLASLPSFFALQTCVGPDQDVFYHFDKAGVMESMKAVPYNLTSAPSIMIKNADLSGYSAQEIAYQCLEIAVTMADDIVRFSVEQMMDNAEHQISMELKSNSGIIDSISAASDVIKDKIGRPANFVILPVGLAKSVKSEIATEYDFDTLPIKIKRIGVIRNKWVTYLNGYEANSILVGYRGSHPVDAGYIYTPNLLFYDPKKEGAGTLKERYIVSRRGRHHIPKPDYFACIEFTADKRSDSIEEF